MQHGDRHGRERSPGTRTRDSHRRANDIGSPTPPLLPAAIGAVPKVQTTSANNAKKGAIWAKWTAL